MSIGTSMSGSQFSPRSHVHEASAPRADRFSFAVSHDTASVKLGAAHVSGAGREVGNDRVVAGHRAETVAGSVKEALSGKSGSRAIDALRHADSFVGSGGSKAFSLSGSVAHDKIFTASHLTPATSTTHQGALLENHGAAHSGAAAHTLLTVGEHTTISVKNVTPTLGGGHFK